MTGLRLEISLGAIAHNARTLVAHCDRRGIAVTGVTKVVLGSPAVARVLVQAGVAGLGDSRIENVERLRRSGLSTPVTLIRSPLLSQVDRVVAMADRSLNTEWAVLAALSAAAVRRGVEHEVLLMVELGDLREGVLPTNLVRLAERTVRLPHLRLRGIGTNLACHRGTRPDDAKMAELSRLAAAVERAVGPLAVISGGNSANLDWLATTDDVGRVNDLRLGEAILFGREPLERTPIAGLRTDAFALVAEVIEANVKATAVAGPTAQGAFGPVAAGRDRGPSHRALLAVGRQDVGPDGLQPPPGTSVLGISSDHLVLDTGMEPLAVGSEVRFGLGYGAVLAAVTSPFVRQVLVEAPVVRPRRPVPHGPLAATA